MQQDGALRNDVLAERIRLSAAPTLRRVRNLVAAGVIDPAKVVRSALQNSSCIASLLLTTEALVSEIPEEKKEAPAMPGGGGMGGMDF